MQNFGKPVKVVCHNCHLVQTAWQDENGVTKYQCPKCGAVSVSRIMSRRHVILDIYAPKGQVVVNN
jgi:predicted RNA-binding Zn-ribbon protein involved in translation (DUF1610 family)